MRQWLSGEARSRATDALTGPAVGDPAPGVSPIERVVAHVEACLASRDGHRGCGVLVAAPDRHALTSHVLGYQRGEEVLAAVTARTATVVRAGEPVLPLTGPEFAIVVPDLPARRDLLTLAERVVAAATAPIVFADGSDHRATVSVGVAATFGNDVSAGQLVREAGRSRFEAEQTGGNRVVVGSDHDRLAAEARFQVERDLSVALADEQFLLHYQPVADLVTGRVERFEALVRWQHPVRQLLRPASFLPAVIDLGLAPALDQFVVDAAADRFAAVQAAVDRPVAVSVNVGANLGAASHLVAAVADALGRSGLHPNSSSPSFLSLF